MYSKWFKDCLIIDPQKRPTTVQLLNHEFFTTNSWVDDFLVKMRKLVSMHESSLNRSTLYHNRRIQQQSQLMKQQPYHQHQSTINETENMENNNINDLNLMAMPPHKINTSNSNNNQAYMTVGNGPKNSVLTNKTGENNDSSNQFDDNTTITTINNNNFNNQANQYHPIMNKVNITFNNLNTESKASFTSNMTNESNLIINKANQKMVIT